MAIKQINKGEILVFNEDALPIPLRSIHYIEHGRVIPDGTTWLKALATIENKWYAIHKDDTRSGLTIKAKDENGIDVLLLSRLSTYISCDDSRGNTIYFTTERAAENANFKFSFRLGRFYDENDKDRFYGDEKVLRYHTQAQRIDRNKLPKYHTDADEYLVGIEVEKTDYSKRDKGEAWELLTKTGWSKEEDGSLGSGGFEFVSPILPLFNMAKIKEASSHVSEWLNADSNDTCGGHINISRKDVSGGDLLESFKHFAPILYALYPKRLTNRYCMAKQWGKYRSYPEKYSAFYLKGDYVGGIVEIRLFSRVKDEASMYWRLELLQTLIKDGGNLNQLCQKLGCPENGLYKHFRTYYSHEKIGDKLLLIDKYAKQFGTHRNGISPSVKKRINNTMGYDVFPSI